MWVSVKCYTLSSRSSLAAISRRAAVSLPYEGCSSDSTHRQRPSSRLRWLGLLVLSCLISSRTSGETPRWPRNRSQWATTSLSKPASMSTSSRDTTAQEHATITQCPTTAKDSSPLAVHVRGRPVCVSVTWRWLS